MRWHVPPTSCPQTALLWRPVLFPIHTTGGATGARTASSILAHRRHRVLERTPRREMLPVTDPALDLHVLQLLLRVIPHFLLLFAVLLPRHARPEDDVLAHARGVEARPRGMALFEAELGPAFALGDAGVDIFLDNGGADAAGSFDSFAVVVETVGDDGFGTVLVGRHGLRGQACGVFNVVFDVVGPVMAAGRMSENVGDGS